MPSKSHHTRRLPEQLSKLVEQAVSLGLMDIFIASVYALYVEQGNPGNKVDMKSLYHYINTFDTKTGLLFYVFSADILLDVALDHERVTFDSFEETLKPFGEAIQFLPHKYFHMKYVLYLAFQAHKKSEASEKETRLFQYLMNALILLGGHDLGHAMKRVHDIFDVDTKAFIRIGSLKRLNQAPFTHKTLE